MTTQEAIQGLKNLFSEHELDLTNTDSLEILHMAIEALEKRDAKEPIWADGFMVFAKCPVCKELLDLKANYCEHCGQVIDWK